MGLIDALLFGVRDVFDSAGALMPRRSRVKFLAGVADDPENDQLIVGAGIPAGESAPAITNSGTGTLNNVVTTDTGLDSDTMRMTGVAPRVTGFEAGFIETRYLTVRAIGGPLTVVHEGATSTAANRIDTGTGADVTVPMGGAFLLKRDATSNRWIVIGSLAAIELPVLGAVGTVLQVTAGPTLAYGAVPTLTSPTIWDSDLSHKYTLVPANLTGNRNIALPLLAGDDTMVMQAFAQPLTNKTLDSTNSIAAAAISGQLAVARGGTGQDFSASSGFMKFAAGVASVVALATGGETFLTNPTSANLAALMTDEVGYSSGALLVFNKNTPFQDSITISRASVGTTSVDGVVNQNTTLATLGTPSQYSPLDRISGSGWDVDGAVPIQVDFAWQLRPVSANTVTGDLVLMSQVAPGSMTDVVTISSAGGITATGLIVSSLASTTAFSAAGAGGYFSASRSFATDSTERGYLAANTGAASAGAQRWSTYFQVQGQGWNPTAGATRTSTWRWYGLPIQQASNEPTVDLVFESQINNGTIFEGIRFKSALTPATGASIVQTLNAIGTTTQATGIQLVNTTAATSGQQQWSPMLMQRSQGWNSSATASQVVDWGWQVETISTAGVPTSNYKLYSRSNGGAWGAMVNVGSGGSLSADFLVSNGSLVVATTGTFTAGNVTLSDGALVARKLNIGATSTTGILVENPTAANVGTQGQWSPRIRLAGFVWDGSASQATDWLIEQQTAGMGGASYRGDLVISSQRGASGGYVEYARFLGNGGGLQLSLPTATTIGTSTRGLTLTADTVADGTTTVRVSPPVYWGSFAWNSSGSASEAHEWRAYVLPVTAAGTTTSSWVLHRRIAGGGYTDLMTLSSAGLLTISGTASSISVAGTIGSSFNGGAFQATTSGGYFAAIPTTAAGSSARGFQASNQGAATNNNQRYSPYFEWTGAGWNVTASASRSTLWRAFAVPVQQASNEPTIDLVWESNINATGMVEGFRLKSTTGGAAAVITHNAIGASAVGVTTVQGLQLVNTTASDGGTTSQVSPRIELKGTAWNSTGSASETQQVFMYLSPNTVAGTTTSTLIFRSSVNGAGAVTTMQLSSAGALTATTTITAGTGITATTGNITASAGDIIATAGRFIASNNYVEVRRPGIAGVDTDGFLCGNATLADVGTPVQMPGRIRFIGGAYNSTSMLDERHEFTVSALPVTGATTSANLFLKYRLGASGGFTTLVTFTNAGGISALSSIISAGGFSASGGNIQAAAGSVRSTRAAIAVTSTDGLYTENTTAATNGVRIQQAPRLRLNGQIWDGTVTQELNWKIEWLGTAENTVNYQGDLIFAQSRVAAGAYTNNIKFLGAGGINILNADIVPGTPTTSGSIYVEGGAGKFIGSSGTITTFGPADLDGFKATSGHGHCPQCGGDFALEWVNKKRGRSLTVCIECLTEELGDRPWIVRKKAA